MKKVLLCLCVIVMFSSCSQSNSQSQSLSSLLNESPSGQYSETGDSQISSYSYETESSAEQNSETDNQMSSSTDNESDGYNDWRVYDYVELINENTGELFQVRVDDVFDGFKVTALEHVECYFEPHGRWFDNIFDVQYEKEFSLDGTITCGVDGVGITHFILSEESFKKIPKDTCGVADATEGLFRVDGDETIFETIRQKFGDVFSVECNIVVSNIHIMYHENTDALSSLTVVDFDAN